MTDTICDRHDVGRPVVASEQAFSGKVVNVRIDQVQLSSGSDPVQRDVVEHPGAVAVVAVNDQREVAFIQQYRHPAQAELWEIPAGLLDQTGEAPATCAARELYEETDLEAERYTELLSLFLSPGGSDEKITIFLAEGISPAAQRFERSEEEAEFELTWVPLDEAVTAVLDGRITNATSAVAVLAVARRFGV
ncbi:MAG: NUDIX hydrolase [Bowdeniella nasicola]|nr:NUDIX hydrolase [Bowdeniella nasicola]